MKTSLLLFSFVTCLLSACNAPVDVKIKDIKLVKSDSPGPVPPPPSYNIKISAYLVFRNNSKSKFDVLNDKSKVLWNTVAGGGDAEKPSKKTELDLLGASDSISIYVKNGNTVALNEKNIKLGGESTYIITNTGCEIVDVIVMRGETMIYHDSIPFKCGE